MSVATSVVRSVVGPVVRSVVGVGAAINRTLLFTWDQNTPRFDSSLENFDETVN